MAGKTGSLFDGTGGWSPDSWIVTASATVVTQMDSTLFYYQIIQFEQTVCGDCCRFVCSQGSYFFHIRINKNTSRKLRYVNKIAANTRKKSTLVWKIMWLALKMLFGRQIFQFR
jgi:hypothetical protein